MEQPRVVVLVEGESDRIALHALARRHGRDLDAEGVHVAPMGGVTNVRRFVAHYGPHGLDVPLAGLYDAAEEDVVRRGLASGGLLGADDPDGPAGLGFFCCTADLEDELVRALGLDVVEQVIADAGEARSLQLLAGMPAQRGWSRDEVLRRFLTSRGGRKARYAELMVAALEPGRAPRPLLDLLARVQPSDVR